MHSLFKFLILLITMAVFWCFSESFLVPEKPMRPRSTQQLKQEILEVMGCLAEQESQAIEVKAKIQQNLYKYIRACAGGDKKSFFSRLSAQQLQSILKLVQDEKARYEREKGNEQRFLASLSSYMIS